MGGDKVAVVTGASSGIGYYAADELAKRGFTVYGLSRHGEDRTGVKHIICDVQNGESVNEAVTTVVHEAGRIDAVINCAGFGISGAVEYTETDDAQKQFDVNFFGMTRVNRACIPELRRTRGRIINISSVAAAAAIPFQTYYSASKAAVNSYTLALANELRPFGIGVCAVMPGDTSTGFTDAGEKTVTGDDLYKGRISRSVSQMEKDERNGMSAQGAGSFVARLVLKRRLRPLYTIGFSYKAVIVLLKILPAGLSNRIIGMIYAK